MSNTFDYDDFINLIIILAEKNGVSDTKEFEIALRENISNEFCVGKYYTDDFFWAYRAKFDLGFKVPKVNPASTVSNISVNLHKSNGIRNSKEISKSQSSPRIERSTDGFIPSYEKKEVDAKKIWNKKIRSELNKLSHENYDKILSNVESIVKEDSTIILSEFIEIMFEKVQVDILFLSLYSKMCIHFNSQFKHFNPCLLKQCYTEFDKPKPDKPEGDVKSDEYREELEEYGYEENKWKSKRLATIKFIAELKKVDMVNDGIVDYVLTTLLLTGHGVNDPISDDISHACEMLELNSIGEEILRKYMKRIDEFKNAGKLAFIDQVRIQNLIEKNEKFLSDRKKPKPYRPPTEKLSVSTGNTSDAKKSEPYRPPTRSTGKPYPINTNKPSNEGKNTYKPRK